MKSFQMRLNPDNEWDRAVIEFLKSIPRYYRSQEVKRILVTHIREKKADAVPETSPARARSGSPPENDDLGARLDNLF